MKLTAEQISEMAARVHTANQKWWVNIETGEPLTRNFGELMMLCVSELAEALEGDRKNLMDDKLPHRKMIEVELADTLIRTLDIIGGLKLQPQELRPFLSPWPANVAECLLSITSIYVNCVFALAGYFEGSVDRHMSRAVERLVSFADHLGLDIMGAYEEKMAYNAVRADHKIESRLKADGKKY